MPKKQQVLLKNGVEVPSRSSEKKKYHFPKPLVKYSAGKQVRFKEGKYILRSRAVFDTPFDKFTFDVFDDKDRKNEEITTHCNYGFNYTTIKAYAKLLKIFVQAYDLKGLQQFYSKGKSDLLRLNDQIPVDFGGCSPPLNQKLFEMQGEAFWNGDLFFKDLMLLCCLSGRDLQANGLININMGNRKERSMHILESLVYLKLYDKKNLNFNTEQNYSTLITTFHINLKQQYSLAMQAIKKNKEDLGICNDENHLFFACYKNLVQEKDFYAKLLAKAEMKEQQQVKQEELKVEQQAKQQDIQQAITDTPSPSPEQQQEMEEILLANGKRIKRSANDDIYSKIFIKADRKTEARRNKIQQIKQEVESDQDQSQERSQREERKKKKNHKKKSIKKHKDSKKKKHKKKKKHSRRGK